MSDMQGISGLSWIVNSLLLLPGRLMGVQAWGSVSYLGGWMLEEFHPSPQNAPSETIYCSAGLVDQKWIKKDTKK